MSDSIETAKSEMSSNVKVDWWVGDEGRFFDVQLFSLAVNDSANVSTGRIVMFLVKMMS